MSKIVNILHLSDLHFGMEPSEKIPATAVDRRNLTLDGLIKTLGTIDAAWRPQVVAISGDVAWKGKPEDYAKAGEWLTGKLLPVLKLPSDKLVICPGNHDIDRAKTLGMMPPPTADVADDWLKLEHMENFSRPFEAFASFCGGMGMPHPEIGGENNWLSGAVDVDGIRFVVLNSAWFCRGDGDRDRLWLGKPLLEKLAAYRNLSDCASQLFDEDDHDSTTSPVTIVLFHHPHEWLNEYEYNTFGNRQNTLEYLCHHSHIMLNGHVHARPAEPDRLLNRAWRIKGGASYADHAYQNHFSILKIDTANRTFHRLAYEFDPGKNKWRADTEATHAPCYDLKISDGGSKTSQLVIPGKYQEWVRAQCRDMDITKLAGTSSVIRVSLPEIYIPLFTGTGKIDIEDLIPESRTLVIQGRAGSGKTTLAKHFTHMMIQSREWKGMDGWLPVLVFLKDLKGFDATGLKRNADTAEKLLAHWSDATGSFLDVGTIRDFCQAGKVVFFLDGLDEIDEPLREVVATSFHSLKITHENCKIVLSGRPHGVDDPVKKWFGDRIVEISPLLMPQVEKFIHKWFDHVHETSDVSKTLKKTASDMIGEIKSHPSVGELIDSPLMLTAICLLYNDDKELPGQRAELYDRFVTNLLHKRFRGEAPKVRNFLMALASETHAKRTKTISRVEAVRILGDEYKKEGEETDKTYQDRLNAKFNAVEPACGLLKFEKGGFGFIHLTFQEFLTANALVSGEAGCHFDTIAAYWDNDWYREVVQLYIGYLSIQSQAMANAIIRKILDENEANPFARQRLAIRSFADIHQGQREASVTESAVRRLWEIIDSDAEPSIRAEGGELLARLGDDRDLEIFVRIPDGTYETSVGEVELKSFELSKYPVTNRWFRKFVRDDGYNRPEFWSEYGKILLEEKKTGHPFYWYDHKWNCDNHPVVGVSWWEADAFCRWLTKTRNDGWTYRLPSEQEWEAGAAGKENREYPWGISVDKNKCNSGESKIYRTSAVGIFKKGDTPEGLSDMSGNVWEWMCTTYETKKSQPDFSSEILALRGGAWYSKFDDLRSSFRIRNVPGQWCSLRGFRCARIQ